MFRLVRSAIAPGVQLLVLVEAQTWRVQLRTPQAMLLDLPLSQLWPEIGPSLECAAEIAYGNEPLEGWAPYVGEFLRMLRTKGANYLRAQGVAEFRVAR